MTLKNLDALVALDATGARPTDGALADEVEEELLL